MKTILTILFATLMLQASTVKLTTLDFDPSYFASLEDGTKVEIVDSARRIKAEGYVSGGVYIPGMWIGDNFIFGITIAEKFRPGIFVNGNFMPGIAKDYKFYPGIVTEEGFKPGLITEGDFIENINGENPFKTGDTEFTPKNSESNKNSSVNDVEEELKRGQIIGSGKVSNDTLKSGNSMTDDQQAFWNSMQTKGKSRVGAATCEHDGKATVSCENEESGRKWGATFPDDAKKAEEKKEGTKTDEKGTKPDQKGTKPTEEKKTEETEGKKEVKEQHPNDPNKGKESDASTGTENKNEDDIDKKDCVGANCGKLTTPYEEEDQEKGTKSFFDNLTARKRIDAGALGTVLNVWEEKVDNTGAENNEYNLKTGGNGTIINRVGEDIENGGISLDLNYSGGLTTVIYKPEIN